MAKKSDLLKSFVYAFEGIKTSFKEERNMRIHLFAAVLVITTGIVMGIDSTSWCLLVFAIGTVITAELFNTAIEMICNIINPAFDPRIKKIKDISSAAVLCVSIGAAIVGVIVFTKRLIDLLA